MSGMSRATTVACAVVAAALLVLGGADAIWREPLAKARLEVRSNATGVTQQPGTALNYTCAAHELLATQALYWRHQRAGVLWDTWTRGRSELVLTRAAAASDTNTALLCDALYSSAELGADPAAMHVYYVASPQIQLHVASGVPTTPAPTVASRELTLSHNGTSNVHHEGDILWYFCRPNNFVSQWIEIFIEKDGIAMRLSSGIVEMTAADDGTAMFCRVTLQDDISRDWYYIQSNRLPITVLPSTT